MNNRTSGFWVASAFLSTLACASAFGAGFENETLWSGQNAGMANAVVSSVSGSQSIYFNPAGLAGQQGVEISGNFSPTFMKFEGPVQGQQQTSNTSFGPVFGVTAAYGITPRWAVGVGVYTSGGGMADYDPVNVGLAAPANLKGDLSFNEVSVGTGYEILPGFKIGAAWRGVLAKSELSLPTIGTPSTDTTFSGLSQFVAAAYKVGVQWSTEDKTWTAGASYRSNVNFDNMSGSFSTTILNTGSTLDSGSGSLSSAFPSQLSIGVSHAFSDEFKLHLQYDFTNYQKIDAFRTTAVGPVIGTVHTTIATGWRNQNDGRIGVEWLPIESWAFRAGYLHATPVVPIELAQPIFTGAGSENAFTLGAGKQINAQWRADMALAYDHASGSGQAGNPGTFSCTEYAVHLGATTTF